MSAIEILSEAEARRKAAWKQTVALLPVLNGALECLSQVADHWTLLEASSVYRELLGATVRAHREFRIEHNIAYAPFEFFWDNPAEPRHSRLLGYFIDPRAEHGCGLFLLRSFFKQFDLVSPDLPLDEHCVVHPPEEGHIDLLVTRERPDGKYAVIIENKVNGAVDQDEQLQRYYEQLRRRGFGHEEIVVCYLTLRGGSPSVGSEGNIGDRLRLRSFLEHIVPWLESALTDKEDWPSGMRAGMCDNLKHYRNLIKRMLNNERAMQMNEKIFEALQRADKEDRLVSLEDIVVLKDSVLTLEACYRRLMQAKMFSAVRRRLLQPDQLGREVDVTYHQAWGGYTKTTWKDDLHSADYAYGFSIGDVGSVAFGADGGGVYTGFWKPAKGGEETGRFETYVKQEEPSVFTGKSNTWWYSFFYHPGIDGTRPEQHVAFLADEMVQKYKRMDKLVTRFKARLAPQV